MLEAADCWGDDGNHVIYVTDNAANNKVAFQGRGRGWQSCFCHNLNLVMGQVMNSTPAVADLVDNGKKLVRYAKKTSVNSVLKAADPNGRGLKASVPTRWNSEWTMLESISHSFTALQTLPGVADKDEVVRLLELIDRRELDAVVKVLGFFNSASEKLSASDEPTGFLVALVLEHAKRHLEPAPADSQLVKDLKKSLLQHITGPKYGGKVGVEQYLALALHPRYRRLQQVTVDDSMRAEVEGRLKQEAVAAFVRQHSGDTAASSASALETAPPCQPSTSGFSLDLEAMCDDEEDPESDVVSADDRARSAVDREYATYCLDKTGKDVKSGAEPHQRCHTNFALPFATPAFHTFTIAGHTKSTPDIGTLLMFLAITSLKMILYSCIHTMSYYYAIYSIQHNNSNMVMVWYVFVSGGGFDFDMGGGKASRAKLNFEEHGGVKLTEFEC